MLKCNKQGRFMIQIPVRHPSHYVPYYIYNNCALIFGTSEPKQAENVSFLHSNTRFLGQ